MSRILKAVNVIIEDIEKSDFSKCCLNELKREGIKEGDIIKGFQRSNNLGIEFKSPKTKVDCVAWLGCTCRIV